MILNYNIFQSDISSVYNTIDSIKSITDYQTIDIKIIDRYYIKPIMNAIVELRDDKGELIKKNKTDDKGNINIRIF